MQDHLYRHRYMYRDCSSTLLRALRMPAITKLAADALLLIAREAIVHHPCEASQELSKSLQRIVDVLAAEAAPGSPVLQVLEFLICEQTALAQAVLELNPLADKEALQHVRQRHEALRGERTLAQELEAFMHRKRVSAVLPVSMFADICNRKAKLPASPPFRVCCSPSGGTTAKDPASSRGPFTTSKPRRLSYSVASFGC
jgi:hypothetical protein